MFDSFLKKEAMPKDRRLTKEEEMDLLKKFKEQNDIKAYKRLRISLRPLINQVASKQMPSDGDVDISQILARADAELPGILKKYDPTKGALNTHLISNLEGHLGNAVKENVSGPHVPRPERGRLFHYQQAYQQAKMEHGPRPSDDQVLKFMPDTNSMEDLQRIKTYKMNSLVGDAAFGTSEEDSGVQFKDQFLNTGYNPDDVNHSMQLTKNKEVMNRRLDPQEKQIIQKYVFEERSLADTALSLGLTTSQVRKTVADWRKIIQEEGLGN